jgi:Zn ribbon nucleic-acid-binding protein
MRKTLESYPNLVKEFDYKKNSPLKPKDLSFGSNKKVWWKCSKGHKWEINISNRTNGANCPYCSNQKVSKENNLKFLSPNIAKEWHSTKNNNLKPEDFVKGSNKKVWWKCIKGHEWKTQISSRTNSGTNCPKCSNQSSKPEIRILSELETIFTKVDSRHKFKKTEIDIFIKDINIGIEYDGLYFHKNKRTNDIKKNIFLKKHLKKLIRVKIDFKFFKLKNQSHF